MSEFETTFTGPVVVTPVETAQAVVITPVEHSTLGGGGEAGNFFSTPEVDIDALQRELAALRIKVQAHEAAAVVEPAPVETFQTDTPTHSGTLTECPNGHSGLDIHRGLNDKKSVDNGVLLTWGYHCFRCGAIWTANDTLRV